jgi:O-antigen/teichoic acid export membrane protein
MNNNFVKSTLILSAATLLSKILGSIFRIPLQNIAGDEVLGIFSLVYPVYMVALILSVAGIPIAISKLISEANVHQDEDRISHIYKTAVILALMFGITSFLLIFGFSSQIAAVLGGQSTRLALIVVSATLLVAPYMAVYRGYFQGYQDMKPTAISQVLEQLIRVGIILAAAYVLVQQNRTDETVAGGIMIGSILGAAASAVYLRILFARSPLKPKGQAAFSFSVFKKIGKEILYISIPICIGAITMALLNFVDSVTIPFSLARIEGNDENINYLYGIYGRGMSLVQIATVFSSSIVLPLIPLITKTMAENRNDEASGIVARTHFLTHLVSWPAALGLFALTLPLNLALFTDLEGSGVLSIIGLSAVFTSLSILGTGVLQGMNLAKLAAYIILGGVALKLATNILFVNMFGLIGAGYSTLLVYIVIFAVNTFFIWRAVPFPVWSWKNTSMVLSSLIMGAVIGIPTLYLNIGEWSRTTALIYSMLAIGAGGLIYFILLLATKGMDRDDLSRLPIISKLFNRTPAAPAQGGKDRSKDLGKGAEKMKKAMLGLLIVSLILAIPGVYQRFQAEWNNTAYETVIPYSDIEQTSMTGSDLSEGDVIRELKDSGLKAVSIEPETLDSLEKKGYVTTLSAERMKELSVFDEEADRIDTDKDGLFVAIEESNELTDRLQEQFAEAEPEQVTFQGRELLFIPGSTSKIESAYLGYLNSTIEEIKQSGLTLVWRVPNLPKEESGYLYGQLFDLADQDSDRILFLGDEAAGFPDPGPIKEFAGQMNENGMSAYAIEFADQKGFFTLSNTIDMNVIRLHSLDLNRVSSPEEGIDRAVRAVKERNIRSIFLRMETADTGEESLKNTAQFIEKVESTMPGLFHAGKAEPFQKIDVPVWSTLFAFLAAISFIALAALDIFKRKSLFYLALIGGAVISLGYAVLGKTLLVQGLALLVAVITPIYAILPIRDTKGLKNILITYLRAIVVSAIGILIMVALLNGNSYLVKVEAFRGVKLIYVIPIFFMFVYAIWTQIKGLLRTRVEYWHLAVIGIIGIVGLYYISRTGNAGSVSSIELTVRQWLEEAMYVRPRTKEFLIGFPLYVLALYVLPLYKRAGTYLLIPGVIGFLSIMNTFTHLHIPLYVSILRTFYSLALGLIIGLVLIFIFKKALALFNEKIKPRWFA